MPAPQEGDRLNTDYSRHKQEVHNPLKKMHKKLLTAMTHPKTLQTHRLSVYWCHYYFDSFGSIWFKIKDLLVSSSVCTVND